VDHNLAVVINEAQSAKFIHEEAVARACRADDLRKGVLRILGESGYILHEIAVDLDQRRRNYYLCVRRSLDRLIEPAFEPANHGF
jgi:hypothetical protein